MCKNSGDFMFRLKTFVYHLLRFEKYSHILLSGIQYENYISDAYFTTEEIEAMLLFESNNLSLKNKLKQIISEKKSYICSSHDLAPIFIAYFEIPKNFEKEKEFIAFEKQFVKKFLKNHK